MKSLPTGTVTFLFTDIEGATARASDDSATNSMRRSCGAHGEKQPSPRILHLLAVFLHAHHRRLLRHIPL